VSGVIGVLRRPELLEIVVHIELATPLVELHSGGAFLSHGILKALYKLCDE